MHLDLYFMSVLPTELLMNLENMILKLLFEHCKAFVVCRFEILSGVEKKKHNIEGRKITLLSKEFPRIFSGHLPSYS